MPRLRTETKPSNLIAVPDKPASTAEADIHRFIETSAPVLYVKQGSEAEVLSWFYFQWGPLASDGCRVLTCIVACMNGWSRPGRGTLAVASGVSRSGIVYHFPPPARRSCAAPNQHLAEQWEEELERAAGGPAHTGDMKARLRAVVISQSHAATKAELLLEIDARSNPDFSAIWAEVHDRWTPSAVGIEDDEALRSQYLIKVLADGLWVHDPVHEQALTPAQREVLIEQILQMLE